MAMRFRVRRDERRAWTVLVEDQLYGEYLGKDQAVRDAIEAVNEARAAGRAAGVVRRARRVGSFLPPAAPAPAPAPPFSRTKSPLPPPKYRLPRRFDTM